MCILKKLRTEKNQKMGTFCQRHVHLLQFETIFIKINKMIQNDEN